MVRHSTKIKTNLIQDTTKEERENFIKNTFKCISDCDNCGICTIYKVKDPINVYMDYIEGKKEYLELANEYR